MIESTAQTQTAISHASVIDSSHGRSVERIVSVFAALSTLAASDSHQTQGQVSEQG